MPTAQPGILAPAEPMARYLRFDLNQEADPVEAWRALECISVDAGLVVGIGPSLTTAVGVDVAQLRPFPSLSGVGVDMPSTQSALWCWLRSDDRGKLLHASRDLAEHLVGGFALVDLVDGFMYRDSRDLTGYVDGTENPVGDKAREVGILTGESEALEGSSFVAVQQWLHDLDAFEAISEPESDHIIGRRLSDDEEIDDAPKSAHVKRTAQEDFDPEAFIVRRSLPWVEASEQGLMFVAFGRTLDAFEAQLQRMIGLDDGIVDGLFQFTRPLTGGYYWCPPVEGETLALPAPAS